MILAEAATQQLVTQAWHAAAAMVGLSGLFAIALLIASLKLTVKVDPKVEQVYAALPHVDCGACGMAGCSSYAKAVVADPQLLGRCYPGGPKTAAAIAAILSLEIGGGAVPARPIIHCRAHRGDKEYHAAYTGIESCTAANATAPVQACKFGCLGYGDCTAACKFAAMHVVDGLATVDYSRCTGCGACAKTCPRNLIEMVPFTHENMLSVACSSRENGKNTRAFCRVGCIGCGLCAKQTDLFAVKDNLARMDYARYSPCEACETAVAKCPTGVIVYRGPSAPAPRAPATKPEPATA